MASNSIRVYEVGSVTLSIFGIKIEDSLPPEGTPFFKLTPPEFKGARQGFNSITFYRKMSVMAVPFELTLEWSSTEHDKMSAIIAIDALTRAGAGNGPLCVEDGSGRTRIVSESCTITQLPEFSLDANPGPRIWRGIAAISPEAFFVGGG